jgi:excisionase family DNA binding protein
VLATAGGGDDSGVQRLQPKQLLPWSLATPLLRNAGSGSAAQVAEFLTVREAARVLEVSTATVYERCARGELGHVRMVNVVRIAAAAVSATPSI